MKTRIFTLVLGTALIFALFSCRKEQPQPPTIENRDIKEFSPNVNDTVTLYNNLPMLFKKDSIYYYHYKDPNKHSGRFKKDVCPVGVFRGYYKENYEHFFVFYLNDKEYAILHPVDKRLVLQTWLQKPSNKQEIVKLVERDNGRKYSYYVDIYVLYVLQNGFEFYPLYYDKDIKIKH